MNYLLALLAFSAVMIVLSTMASTIVEALHKLFKRRRKDFELMLENLYEGSIKRRFKDVGELPVGEFVEKILKNPAFESINQAKPNPLTNYFFDSRFEKLSTTQFVEQLASTQIGVKISEKVGAEKEALIQTIATEFERYGESASYYFKRRAQVISMVAAIILAFVLNVDALKLYQTLAADSSLAQTVIENIDVENYLKIAAEGADAKPKVAPSETKPKVAAVEDVPKEDTSLVAQGEGVVNAAQEEGAGAAHRAKDAPDSALKQGAAADAETSNGAASNTKTIEDNYLQLKKELGKNLEDLNSLSLPIGHGYFPYCKAEYANKFAQDARCDRAATIKDSSVGGRILSTPDGWAWLFNTLVAGLLIGLGAPFWFKTYQFLAALVPQSRTGAETDLRENVDDASKARRHAQGQVNAQGPDDAKAAPNKATVVAQRLTNLFDSAYVRPEK